MTITRIGVDLAKQVFQIHGVDRASKVQIRKQLRRSRMLDYFGKLPPCLIGMEACSSAHYWARELSKLGRDVRLMAPQFVKPYVKSGKNDANDAEAICEAVGRPNMRFVGIKTVDQQVIQAEHRIRARLVKSRTALSNEIRGFLAEFGIVVAVSIGKLRKALPELLEDGENGLPGDFRVLLARLGEELQLGVDLLQGVPGDDLGQHQGVQLVGLVVVAVDGNFAFGFLIAFVVGVVGVVDFVELDLNQSSYR